MNHQHLVLSPNDFIIMIGQGLATHINLNAEKLRKEFVNHEGKERIEERQVNFENEHTSEFIKS